MKVTKGQLPSGCSWTARATDDHEVSSARDIFMVTKTHENGGGKFDDRVSWFIDFSVGYYTLARCEPGEHNNCFLHAAHEPFLLV
jgi:hypothetical protein